MSRFQLRLDEDVILNLQVIHADFPWMFFRYYPTPLYAEVRGLIRAHGKFLRHSDRVCKGITGLERSGHIWQKLLTEGLNFYHAETEEEASWFYIRVDRHQMSAKFNFPSHDND